MGDVQQLSSIWCTPLKDNLITKKIKQNNSADKIDIYYEQQIRKDACKYVTTFDTFVDVGANIGIWTMPLKSKFKL